MILLVVAGLVLLNLCAWLAGEKIFIDDARQMDRKQAVHQAELVGNLLEREARSLQRIILGRTERLQADEQFRRSGLAAIDFDQTVTEAFLGGANIDAYLVSDPGASVLFSAHYQPTPTPLPPLSPTEQQRLADWPKKLGGAAGGFAGVDLGPGAGAMIVAGVPVRGGGWIIACRDLNSDQVARYGELAGKPFELLPLAAAVATSEGNSPAVAIDAEGEVVRWRIAGLSGEPVLQLAMAYDRTYEKHMAHTILVSRIGLLLITLVAGGVLFIWLWHRQLQEERLAASRREVEQIARLAMIGELAAGVAHEINNPGGMIQRNLEFVGDVLDDALPLLAERKDAGQLSLGGVDFALAREQLPQLLDDMTRGARRIGEIVRDLKDFARGDAPDNMTRFDLNQAVAAAVRLLDGTIRKATDHFAVDLAPGLPPVYGNLRQIEQVVLNLVQNACQSLSDRSSEVVVITRHDPRRRLVLVEVADEGAGIPAELAERIFEPFFTTRRETGGTGLGLSVSRRIVQRHGGKIDVNSVPGNGTVMTLSLPVAEEDA